MWSNFLFILELVVLYGVPLLESLDALKKESDSSKIKKWAAFWAIQIGINAISPLFWFLSGILTRIFHMIFTVWLYHPDYKGSLYITEIADKLSPRSIDALYLLQECSLRDGPLSAFRLIQPVIEQAPYSIGSSRITRSPPKLQRRLL